jgi:hypothetical protein
MSIGLRNAASMVERNARSSAEPGMKRAMREEGSL